MKDNPLLEPQREKAGSTTFSKYLYQYHWALFRVIEEHKKSNEYAVFLELHEDVVISNSLEQSRATFEFNQVKTNKQRFTELGLTKKTKTKPSVLAKLIESCVNKDYSHLITSINLVSTSGFSFSLKEPEFDFEVIQISDLADTSFEEIEKKLKSEIECEGLPENLRFIIPQLPEKEYQDNVVGKISGLINHLFPSSNCNSIDVYRTLIDELQRKGKNTFDYRNWTDAIKNKSLTSDTVTEVLNTFTSRKNENDISTEFEEIAKEIGLNTIKKRQLKNAFNRYRTKRIGARNSGQLNTTKRLKTLINENIESCEDSIEILMNLVNDKLDEKVKKQFANEVDLNGAIICEYIMIEHE